MRILDSLDYESAARYPKVVTGYSDITALQLAMFKNAGWRGLSGPMVAVEWPESDPASETSFWSLARGGTPASLTNPDGSELLGLVSGNDSVQHA